MLDVGVLHVLCNDKRTEKCVQHVPVATQPMLVSRFITLRWLHAVRMSQRADMYMKGYHVRKAKIGSSIESLRCDGCTRRGCLTGLICI